MEREYGTNRTGWFLSGLIIGGVTGLLLAPKSGIETRHDLEDLRRRSAERGRSLASKLGIGLGTRVKAGAAAGAVQGGAESVVSAAKDKLTEYGGT